MTSLQNRKFNSQITQVNYTPYGLLRTKSTVLLLNPLECGTLLSSYFLQVENIFLYIKCKERSIDCTSACMFLIHSKAVQECYWIRFALECLSIVPKDFQDNVNHSNVGVNESIFFSFVCRIAQMNAPKCYWMLIKIESDLCANVRFFALMNASSRCWSPFHANKCVFSRNEQQKVY